MAQGGREAAGLRDVRSDGRHDVAATSRFRLPHILTAQLPTGSHTARWLTPVRQAEWQSRVIVHARGLTDQRDVIGSQKSAECSVSNNGRRVASD